MAVFFRGLALDERVALTLAMRDSGRCLTGTPPGAGRRQAFDRAGDTVSLDARPALATVGLMPDDSGQPRPYLWGRSTFDAIPGCYRTQPDLSATLRCVVAEVGCAIIGQTDDIVPADRRFYGIRATTATG